MKKTRRRWAIALVVLFVLVFALKILAAHPLMIHNGDVPEDYFMAIQDQAQGLYSNRIPLVPLFVSIDNLEQDTVFYIIHYFPFGTVGMSYAPSDGYNIEKPLAYW